MADELVDLIDDDNNVIGQEMKSVVHRKGLPHRVSAILLKNSEDKYLIPTASDLKAERGKLFHSATGHVTRNETYAANAVRELFEECNLKIDIKDLKFLTTYWLVNDYKEINVKERFEVYEVIYKEDMGQVKLNEEQINEQWLTLSELKVVYNFQKDKMSLPLILTCKNIFNFNLTLQLKNSILMQN